MRYVELVTPPNDAAWMKNLRIYWKILRRQRQQKNVRRSSTQQ